MKIEIERPKENKEQYFKGRAETLLTELNINPEEVIIVRNGEIVTLDEELEDEDHVKILSVVSGG